jgi:hypothetical protein
MKSHNHVPHIRQVSSTYFVPQLIHYESDKVHTGVHMRQSKFRFRYLKAGHALNNILRLPFNSFQ